MAGKDTNSKRIDTVIGKDTTVRGTVEAEGTIRVDGRFEGDISTAGDLIVGESGFVQGTVVAKNVSIAGQLHGKVEARGRLELLPSANVQGEIKMVLLVVEEGACLQGNCEALPRGDLKERGKALRVETPQEVKK
ncbi:MAG: bactofilin family protein [Bacteroidota bacterium]